MTAAQHRTLGANGPEVFPIGLGFMSFRTSAAAEDERQAKGLVDAAIDAGVTLFDTADVYGPEISEILLGRAISGRRDSLTIATKFGNALDRDTNPDARLLDGRPEYVRTAIEGSLRRLGVDHVDLYYLHRVDPQVPIEDTVGALGELVDDGKVRFIGLSEPGPETLRRAHAVHPISALQNEWSLFTRDLEDSIVPLARELGIGIVPYSPLGRGWLTGRVRSADDVKQRQHPRFAADVFARNRALADTVAAVASDIGAQPGQVALAWVLGRGRDVVPIPGTRHPEYLLENIGALEVRLADDHVRRLDTIAGQVEGHRSIRPENLGTEAPLVSATAGEQA